MGVGIERKLEKRWRVNPNLVSRDWRDRQHSEPVRLSRTDTSLQSGFESAVVGHAENAFEQGRGESERTLVTRVPVCTVAARFAFVVDANIGNLVRGAHGEDFEAVGRAFAP